MGKQIRRKSVGKMVERFIHIITTKFNYLVRCALTPEFIGECFGVNRTPACGPFAIPDETLFVPIPTLMHN